MSARGIHRAPGRRRLIAAVPIGALVSATAVAQTRSGPRRIAMLGGNRKPPLEAPLIPAFRDRLRELGWVEGRTITIEERFADGRFERLPELARELIALDVEVIVTIGGAATGAAHATTHTIPIVMIQGGGAVEAGWIRSLARPGGNITGTAPMSADLAGKHIELLHQLVPAARRLAILANLENPEVPIWVANAAAAGRSLGLEVATFAVARIEDFAPTLARIGDARPDALLVGVEALISSQRATVIGFAERSRLPALYTNDLMIQDGALMSYGPDTAAFFARTADFVDKILRGANPAELPVEQPTTFSLAVNLRTARALGIEVPRIILDRADEVIE